jgi:hypothetical protein
LNFKCALKYGFLVDIEPLEIKSAGQKMCAAVTNWAMERGRDAGAGGDVPVLAAAGLYAHEASDEAEAWPFAPGDRRDPGGGSHGSGDGESRS